MTHSPDVTTPGGDPAKSVEQNGVVNIVPVAPAKVNADSGRIMTILRHSTNFLCKTWQADGTIKPYDNAKHFTVTTEEVAGIEGLSHLLAKLEHDPHACVIRGAYVGEQAAIEIDREHRAGFGRRILGLFVDTPRHWVMIDVDNFVPQSADPVLEPVKAIDEYIVASLPSVFHGVDYHWQLSNAAGRAKNAGKLKAHVWFWLAKPYSSAQLNAWATAHNIDTDKSLFHPVQIHYTAAPVFEGVSNPVPVRSGFVVGLTGYAVELVIDATPIAAPVKPTTRQRLADLQSTDPVARMLNEKGMIKSLSRDGEQLNIGLFVV